MTKEIRVLVVDDQLDVAQSLADIVSSWGYTTKTVYSGEQALETAEEFQPHAVLLDIMMPGMDGYNVAQELRNAIKIKESIIIGVTALGDDSHRHQGWDSGFHHYMVKPVDHPKLKQHLENLSRSVQIEEKRTSKAVAAMTSKLEKRLKAT